MFNHASVPHMGRTQSFYRAQHMGSDVVQFAHAILLNGAVKLVFIIGVGKPARHQLVDDDFLFCHISVGIFSKNIGEQDCPPIYIK